MNLPPSPARPAIERPARFSPRRVLALAASAFTQLTRMKVFFFLLVFGLIVLGSSLFVHHITDQGLERGFEARFAQQLKVVKDMSSAAMSLFASLFAIAATALLLPGDAESRTLYTILAKPVPRWEYLAGKYLGVLAVILVILAAMSAIFAVILSLQQQALLRKELAWIGQPDPETLATLRAALHRHGLNTNLISAVIAIFLKAAVVAAVTLFLSTFASSSLFTMIAGFAVFVIGHLLPLAIEYWTQVLQLEGPGLFFAGVVSALIPNFQAFDVVDPVLSGAALPSGTLPRLSTLAAGYAAVFLMMSSFIFSAREL
jgi:ABC-type transport system involved in multi-copper enzyme maturation permease subunit